MDDHGSSVAEVEDVTGDDPRQLLNRPGLVLVEFWAEWCSPCHAMRAEIERFAAEAPDDVAVCAVNITESPRTAEHFAVVSVPSIVILRDGETVHRSAGAMRRSQIARLVAGAR